MVSYGTWQATQLGVFPSGAGCTCSYPAYTEGTVQSTLWTRLAAVIGVPLLAMLHGFGATGIYSIDISAGKRAAKPSHKLLHGHRDFLGFK